MAYNVYFMCDECGEVGANFTNTTVSYTKAEKIAKSRYGWHVSKNGAWICPTCWERVYREKKSHTISKSTD